MTTNVQKARETLRQARGWVEGGGAPAKVDQIANKVSHLTEAVKCLCDELDKRAEDEHRFHYIIHRVGDGVNLTVSPHAYSTPEDAVKAGRIEAKKKYPDDQMDVTSMKII